MATKFENFLNDKQLLYQTFFGYFEEVISTVLQKWDEKGLEDVKKRFSEILRYNVQGGKCNRGIFAVSTYLNLVPSEKFSIENFKNACFLGWCIEILQAYALVIDDIMDNSETRRGKICWYRNENIGMSAINDAILLKCAALYLIKFCFRGQNCYHDMLELFQDTIFSSHVGQCLDLISCGSGENVNDKNFTSDKHDLIVKYKTGYYSFVLPVRAGLYMAGLDDAKIHTDVENLMLKIGVYFQNQDDFLDCFGNSDETGKVGTDIQDGKCTWLVVKALSLAADDQNKILAQNYGVDSNTAIEIVKIVYRDLNIVEKYHEYEHILYGDIVEEIDKLSGQCKISAIPFKMILDKIYKRSK